jgi:hypothetical protein
MVNDIAVVLDLVVRGWLFLGWWRTSIKADGSTRIGLVFFLWVDAFVE